jgi:dTDP-4-dehydrorhamnose reductase
MAILVTGAEGQLGKELCRHLAGDALPVDIGELDLSQTEAIGRFVQARRPAAVINCAAYTQVDRAETEADLCRRVNAVAVERLAAVCSELACPLVQISTDYVFGGAGLGRPWREGDPPDPTSVYAQTKYEGERAAAGASQHFIVRTCGLFARPSDPTAKNFVRTMLRLGETGRPVRVVDDQRCTPSYVPHVARAILFLLGWPNRPAATGGVYHITNAGETTWHEMAAAVFARAGQRVPLEAITTAEYNALAARPAYSVLDTTKYHRLGGPAMPDWREALDEYFHERHTAGPPAKTS